jgi:tetratricopeptide (TPR) repeat protein
MRTSGIGCILALLAAAPAAAQMHGGHDSRRTPSDSVPFFEGLGTLSRPITTASELAGRYFDQGLRLTYGFGHGEAVRSFREALKHDPACAMCAWGVSWALGPYINEGRDSAHTAEAWVVVNEAKRLAAVDGAATEIERALIDAMSRRYERTPTVAREAALDSAYASAMREVVRRFPHDLDAATLFAESLMVLRPWDHWTREGLPQPGTDEVLAVLESVLGRDIRHPGACHLYVHAVEASPRPERAAPCAEFLGDAIPAASHVPHMPSHIWMRIGRYGDAVRANQRAWQADLDAVRGRGVQIYPTHNLHMLLFAASFDGQSAVAWQAARDLSRIAPAMSFYVPLVLVRFGRWQDILDLDEPPEDSFEQGMWLHARGLAHLRTDAPDSARTALDTLSTLLAGMPDSVTFRGHAVRHLLGVARAILAAEIAASKARWNDAERELRDALPLEDSLEYDEPEPWIMPARHVLGAILVDAGRPAEAEVAYREALRDHRENGWSLLGLAQAIRAQGRESEADEVTRRFESAWQRADVRPWGSRY